MRQIKSMVSYMILSEDTAEVKKNGEKSVMIFSPLIVREIYLPGSLHFTLSIGVEFDPEDSDLVVNIYAPDGENISTIEVGKYLIESDGRNDTGPSYGNFSIATGDGGLPVHQEGLYKFIAEIDGNELYQTYLVVQDPGGDLIE